MSAPNNGPDPIPPGTPGAFDIRGQQLDGDTIMEIANREIQSNRLGQTSGLVVAVGGIVLTILGATGSVDWIVDTGEASSRVTNASPGVLCILVGAGVLVIFRPRVRIER